MPSPSNNAPTPDYDVLIVGAGISGISAACHLRMNCPDRRFRIVEARDSFGGTWDLFRYPGIRSDSDMHTFGFSFRPWTSPVALADGPSILAYLEDTIKEYDLAPDIDFGRRVVAASWSDDDRYWTVTLDSGDGDRQQLSCRVLFMCSGYYRYDAGYTPELPGLQDFRGTLVHPQHWPEGLDYRGKRIAVIGSGATAVTLVPALAGQAAKVAMIQRSPTWVVSLPREDRLAKLTNRLLPQRWAYRITRWRNIRLQNFIYKRSRNKPAKVRRLLLRLARKHLGEDFDVQTHFTPDYDPWTQRMCLIPDADLFLALRSGKAAVVTGEIDHIGADAVHMRSGEAIQADILVTATGLQLQLLGGAEFTLNGEPIDFSERIAYQGMMYSGVPNLVQTFGYINASWTLRADLNSRFVCDMLNHMRATGTQVCTPVLSEEERTMPTRDWVTDFNPGYFQRALHLFPRQGTHVPWRNTQNYLLDRKLLRRAAEQSDSLSYR
ncbi:MAG: NAD(P)/FAD-dependent oxidoreductase [Pseudohongiellaceae bacterium]